MIGFLKDNIGWIKDIFTIALALTATVISILTYRRARATILAPIRNEVVKKQSEILSELLGFIREHENSIDRGVDYVNLAKLNTFVVLKEFGFLLKNQDEIDRSVEEMTALWIMVPKSNVLEDVEVVGIHSSKKSDTEVKEDEIERRRRKYEAAKQGKAEITKIHITKKHEDYFNKISEYVDSPFLPNGIQTTLKEIQMDISENRSHRLIQTLEDFINSYVTNSSASSYKNVSPDGVFNAFNRNRVHHFQKLVQLKGEIRKYLRIDDEW